MTPGPREWTLGTHILRFEPPDLLWVTFRGPIRMPDARFAHSVHLELADARPLIFVGDMKEVGSLDPEAGRYLSENIPSDWVVANIYVGARLIHRAIAKGLALASLLVEHRDKRAVEKIHHVATPAEALALVARLRAEARQEAPGPRP